jgi:hypothetical protein
LPNNRESKPKGKYMYKKEDVDKPITLAREINSWLLTQRGMIAKDYAYDLAKIITMLERR